MAVSLVRLLMVMTASGRQALSNRVAWMGPSEVAAFLEARGYTVLRAERYAMYYRITRARCSAS